jgi:hypothetical protein
MRAEPAPRRPVQQEDRTAIGVTVGLSGELSSAIRTTYFRIILTIVPPSPAGPHPSSTPPAAPARKAGVQKITGHGRRSSMAGTGSGMALAL